MESELNAGFCGVCISDLSNGDLPVFYAQETVRARKEHVCCECGDIISSGTSYERSTGKWDDEVKTYKTCLPCAEIRNALCCDGWSHTALWMDAEESELFQHLTTGCLEQLTTAAAKTKLLAKWRAWKGLA